MCLEVTELLNSVFVQYVREWFKHTLGDLRILRKRRRRINSRGMNSLFTSYNITAYNRTLIYYIKMNIIM
jgi:hypothetical protein